MYAPAVVGQLARERRQVRRRVIVEGFPVDAPEVDAVVLLEVGEKLILVLLRSQDEKR